MIDARTRIRRHPERAQSPDVTAAILDEGLVAHVGLVDDGRPVVVPMTYLHRDGAIYLHGAPASRAVRLLASGAPVCIEVTLVDGLVASKTAESHSVNYRSAVVFGRGTLVTDRSKARELFEALIGRYFDGRTAGAHYAHITEPELKRTWLVEVTIDGASGKARTGGPRGAFDDDPSVPGVSGVYPAGRVE
jgi:uncharacterized protein